MGGGRGPGKVPRRWRLSERHALPHRPLPRGLWNRRAPPDWRRVGCPHPKATPAPPAQRARRGPRDADTASPRFRGPGPARCARTGLGPGPGARTAPGKHLLCTEPGKLSPSLVAFMAADGGSWPVMGWGALVYMVAGFSFIFPHPPPSFSQLRRPEDGCKASATSAA